MSANNGERMVTEYTQERILSPPENPFTVLVPDQQVAVIPSFTLESGGVLRNAPVAYTTRGTLNAAADNPLILSDDDEILSTGNFYTVTMAVLTSPLSSGCAQGSRSQLLSTSLCCCLPFPLRHQSRCHLRVDLWAGRFDAYPLDRGSSLPGIGSSPKGRHGSLHRHV